MADAALLVVDMQTGFLEGQFAVAGADALLENVLNLITAARHKGLPVVFIRHDESPEYDGPLHPSLQPQADEPIVAKLKPNAFHETELAQVLAKIGATQLILAGLQTEVCIAATSREAHARGYSVTILEDVHSTLDSESQTAAAIIADHNEQFRQFAQLVPLASLFSV